MSIAASSALRVDETAYGSLERLATSLSESERKFRKKPVLVLDADELAAAHAAFHEASAEQLDDTVERAPRPATILGLVPMMQDDIAEMEQPEGDDAGAVEAGSLGARKGSVRQSSDDILGLARHRTATLDDATIDDATLDDIGADKPSAPQSDAASLSATADDNENAAARALLTAKASPPSPTASARPEDGLDMATRIFPSLPMMGHGDDDEEDEDFAPVQFPQAVRPAACADASPMRPNKDSNKNPNIDRGRERKNREIAPPAGEDRASGRLAADTPRREVAALQTPAPETQAAERPARETAAPATAAPKTTASKTAAHTTPSRATAAGATPAGAKAAGERPASAERPTVKGTAVKGALDETPPEAAASPYQPFSSARPHPLASGRRLASKMSAPETAARSAVPGRASASAKDNASANDRAAQGSNRGIATPADDAASPQRPAANPVAPKTVKPNIVEPNTGEPSPVAPEMARRPDKPAHRTSGSFAETERTAAPGKNTPASVEPSDRAETPDKAPSLRPKWPRAFDNRNAAGGSDDAAEQGDGYDIDRWLREKEQAIRATRAARAAKAELRSEPDLGRDFKSDTRSGSGPDFGPGFRPDFGPDARPHPRPEARFDAPRGSVAPPGTAKASDTGRRALSAVPAPSSAAPAPMTPKSQQREETSRQRGEAPARQHRQWPEPGKPAEDTVPVADDLIDDFAPEPEGISTPAPSPAPQDRVAAPSTASSATPPANGPDAPQPATGSDQPESHSITAHPDDAVADGYAFLNERKTRRDAINATQNGQQSALRARLIGEKPGQQPARADAPTTPSLFTRLWRAIRSSSLR